MALAISDLGEASVNSTSATSVTITLGTAAVTAKPIVLLASGRVTSEMTWTPSDTAGNSYVEISGTKAQTAGSTETRIFWCSAPTALSIGNFIRITTGAAMNGGMTIEAFQLDAAAQVVTSSAGAAVSSSTTTPGVTSGGSIPTGAAVFANMAFNSNDGANTWSAPDGTWTVTHNSTGSTRRRQFHNNKVTSGAGSITWSPTQTGGIAAGFAASIVGFEATGAGALYQTTVSTPGAIPIDGATVNSKRLYVTTVSSAAALPIDGLTITPVVNPVAPAARQDSGSPFLASVGRLMR